ncbi:MAG TPA: GntR family transcriptional regulator, partial [Pseudonocardiaceae bacterium]
MRYRETLTVPVMLDRGATVPLHEQIAGQLGRAVAAGSLAPGTRLPSTRTLAALLGVSRGVAAAGYDVLMARGFAEGR